MLNMKLSFAFVTTKKVKRGERSWVIQRKTNKMSLLLLVRLSVKSKIEIEIFL